MMLRVLVTGVTLPVQSVRGVVSLMQVNAVGSRFLGYDQDLDACGEKLGIPS